MADNYTMHTPPANQGQTVERSYGWYDALYMRVHDRADQTIRWYRATDQAEVDAYADSGSEPWDEEPSVATWTACAAPEAR